MTSQRQAAGGRSDLMTLIVAVTWMCGAVAGFLIMAIAGRELSDTMSVFQVVFFRTLVALFLVLGIVAKARFRNIATRRLPLHIFRNSVHICAMGLWFLAITLLPLSMVFSIEFTTPIWVTLMAPIFIGQRLNAVRILSVILGFIGVLVILRPGVQAIEPAALIALAAAFLYSFSYIATKPLSDTDGPLAILFYMAIVQLIIAIGPALYVWVAPEWRDLPWILMVGCGGVFAHYCFTRAFMMADTSIVLPVDYLRLPLAILIGYLFYAEALDPMVLLGAVIIITGNLINIRHESKRLPKA